ncbi:MAG TPA: hypothetical protein EYH00_03710 [Archaeoglobus profundus]|nr:hypothetical protein [Archaeoglobus profundus]
MKYKLLAVILLVMLITTANGLQVEVTPTPVKPNDTFTITITLDKPTVLGIIIPLNGIKFLNCSAKYEIKDNKLMMVAVNDSVKCTFLNVNTTIVRCEWIDFVNEMKGNKTIYLKPAKIPTTPTPTPTIHGPTPVPTIYPTTPVLTTTKETPGFELALAIIALIYVLRRWYNR